MLIFLIFVCTAFSQEVFGAIGDVQSRIYGGTAVGGIRPGKHKVENVASSTEYPYVVELDVNGSQWCGGTLIRKDAIISAAHCFSSSRGIEARAGNVYRNSEKAPGLQKRRVIQIVKHPDYAQIKIRKSIRAINDIAILKVAKPFDITQYVDIIQVPGSKQVNSFANEIGTILGWGETENSVSSSILLKANLIILDNSACAKELKTSYEGNLCAIGRGKKGGLGGGDSGGPFVKHTTEQPKNAILLGVISFGYDKDHPYKICKTVCDESSPSVMTNVAYYSNWIRSTLNSL